MAALRPFRRPAKGRRNSSCSRGVATPHVAAPRGQMEVLADGHQHGSIHPGLVLITGGIPGRNGVREPRARPPARSTPQK